jgi:hypothetical protein
MNKPRQRRPHERSVRVLITPCPGQPDIFIRVTQDGEHAHYWVHPMQSDFGLAYKVEKPGFEGSDEYDVLLEIEGDSCTCKGHTYCGYCKHVDALRALHTQGRLPLPTVPHGPAAEGGGA